MKNKDSYLSYCQPYDVARRLAQRKRHWFHGKPKIYLKGKNNQFGVLLFDFQDEKIKYNIFIKDREKILNAAYIAVDNINSLIILT